MTTHQMSDEETRQFVPFKSDAEAQRRLGDILNNGGAMPSAAVLNVGPTMHTTLVQIARIVCGELSGTLIHAELIEKVRVLKSMSDRMYQQLCRADDEQLGCMMDRANLVERLAKAEDMVARQAGEIHNLREINQKNGIAYGELASKHNESLYRASCFDTLCKQALQQRDHWSAI